MWTGMEKCTKWEMERHKWTEMNWHGLLKNILPTESESIMNF
jgi:hypothetical protein